VRWLVIEHRNPFLAVLEGDEHDDAAVEEPGFAGRYEFWIA
jgi:hypothetical protein